MKTYQVNEVFTSIQGEGPGVGRLAVFVRFSGCLKTCGFCDTRHSTWDDYELKNLLSLIREETRMFQGSVDCVLTGGEPLLQLDRVLLEGLVDEGYVVHIETSGDAQGFSRCPDSNGVISVLKSLDTVHLTMSPKDSDYSDEILKRASCLKVLCPLLFEERLLDKMIGTLSRHGGRCQADLVLQPVTPPDGTSSWKWQAACKEALALATHRKIHHDETWRVIPQNHVLMGFR